MPDYTFSRELRLRRQKEIDSVYKSGCKLTNSMLKIVVKENNLPFSRLAISVPKKLCNAVRRNRWKRLIREAFRLNKEKIGAGLDIVAIPLVEPVKLKLQDIEPRLIELIKQFKDFRK